MEPNIEGVDIWCFLLMLKFLQWYLLKVHVGTHMFFFFFKPTTRRLAFIHKYIEAV